MIPERIIGINGNGIITTSGFKIPIGNAVRKVGDTVYIDGQYAIMGQERYSSRVPYVPPQIKFEEYLPLYAYDANMNFYVFKVTINDGLKVAEDPKLNTEFTGEINKLLNNGLRFSGMVNNSHGERIYIEEPSYGKYAVTNIKGDKYFIDGERHLFRCRVKGDTISIMSPAGDALSITTIHNVKDLSCTSETKADYDSILFCSESKIYFYSTKFNSVYDYTDKRLVDIGGDVHFKIDDNTDFVLRDCVKYKGGIEAAQGDIVHKGITTVIFPTFTKNLDTNHPVGVIINIDGASKQIPDMFILNDTLLIIDDVYFTEQGRTLRTKGIVAYKLLSSTKIGTYVNKTKEILNTGYSFVRK